MSRLLLQSMSQLLLQSMSQLRLQDPILDCLLTVTDDGHDVGLLQTL
jgi:hypothetical protein